MQVKKQQLKLDMEKWTVYGSKLGKEYVLYKLEEDVLGYTL